MHVGIVTACCEPVINGVTQMVALYEKYLAAAGHQVTVFTLGKPTDLEDPSRIVRSPGLPLGKTGYYLARSYSSDAQYKLRTVDILHCHHPLMGLEFARRYSQAPIVFTNHTRYDLYLNSYGHMPSYLADKLAAALWRRVASLADAVIAPSTSIKSLLVAAGVDVPIEVIANGIEVNRFQHVSKSFSRSDLGIPEDAVVCTYVGRLAPEKSVVRLVDELCLAASRNKKVYILMIGAGPLKAKVERLIAGRGLSERACLPGHVAPMRIPEYLALSDIFVSASVSEVHPLTAIEAMAAGLPVVAVDALGFGDIVVSEETGLLVSRTEASLAQAIVTLATETSLRGRLASGAEQAAKRFEIQYTIAHTLMLYRRLLAKRSNRSDSNTAIDSEAPDARSRSQMATGRFLGCRSLPVGEHSYEQ